MSFLSYRLREKLSKLEQQRCADKHQVSDVRLFGGLFLFALKFFFRSMLARRPKSNCLNIGFVLSGGLGDQLISAQWVKAMLERLEQEHCLFYAVICCPNESIGRMITQGYPHVDKLTNLKFFKKHKFDVLLDLNYFVKFWTYDAQAVAKYAPSLVADFENAQQIMRPLLPFSNYHYHFQLMNVCLAKGLNRYDLMGCNGLCQFDRKSQPYFQVDDAKVRETLAKFKLLDKPFIILHSGVGDVPLLGVRPDEDPKVAKQRVTRVLPQSLGEEIFAELKQRFPEYVLVQIGEPEGLRFKGSDLCLIGKTSLEESLDLLYAAAAYIDNDSGLVHVRHVMHKRSVVIWGPTAGDFVGYPEDENLQGNCQACMWLTEDWNLHCPRGYECARCMLTHSAKDVANSVARVLASSNLR